MADSDSTLADQIREQLRQVVAVVRPYAMSSGPFNELCDVRAAVNLAMHALERAQRLLNP